MVCEYVAKAFVQVRCRPEEQHKVRVSACWKRHASRHGIILSLKPQAICTQDLSK
jgi:hypothetical protein